MSPPPHKMGLDFLLSPAEASRMMASTKPEEDIIMAHGFHDMGTAFPGDQGVISAECSASPSASALGSEPAVAVVSSAVASANRHLLTVVARAGGHPEDLVTPAARHTCRCGEMFTRSIHYLYHVSEGKPGCDETEGVLFRCPVPDCQSAFRRKTDRAKHQSCVHTKLRPFKCSSPRCPAAFFFSKDERKHFATVHLKQRPFKCPQCEQTFGKKEHLKNHVNRTHLQIKPFGCKICNVRLASRHNLLSHVKTRQHLRAASGLEE